MSSFRHYIQDHRQGAFAFGAPTADVAEVTGRPPEDFATIARRYAATPGARRSVGNGVKALMDVLRTPLSPGYNPERFDRQQGFPVPPSPRFALQDERWQIEHGPLGGVSDAPPSREGGGGRRELAMPTVRRPRPGVTSRGADRGAGIVSGGAVGRRYALPDACRCTVSPGLVLPGKDRRVR